MVYFMAHTIFTIFISIIGWIISFLLVTMLCYIAHNDSEKWQRRLAIVCWILLTIGITILWLFLVYGELNPFCSTSGFLIWLGLGNYI